jgi:alkylation response protein AidB-like acyl-CoA dehydrogenase
VHFDWTDEQQAYRKSVIKFAKTELGKCLSTRDQTETFSREDWDKCGEFGIQGLPISPDYGGGGADCLTTVCGLEALGYGFRDNGLLFSINAHMWACEIPFVSHGTAEQKKRYLPKLASGEWIGVHGLTEPMSGSDAYSLTTSAVRKGDRYVLNGSKTFITNGEVADVVLVFATTDPEKGQAGICAFIVDKGTPGFNISRKLQKMGLRTSPMAELAFVDCEVPAENMLGKEGDGPAIFTNSMEWERICIMATHLGLMQRVLEMCVRYAKERTQFGESIGKFSAISDRIAEMDVRLEASRLLLHKAAWLKAQGRHPLREASISKLFVSESTVQTCLDAMQIHGGNGYMTEFQIERELRDALGGRIYSGTSEIQKNIIARLHGL